MDEPRTLESVGADVDAVLARLDRLDRELERITTELEAFKDRAWGAVRELRRQGNDAAEAIERLRGGGS